MKITITPKPEVQREITYPCLLISDSPVKVILATKANPTDAQFFCGVVLQSELGTDTGLWSDRWIMKYFTKFKGLLTIEQ